MTRKLAKGRRRAVSECISPRQQRQPRSKHKGKLKATFSENNSHPNNGEEKYKKIYFASQDKVAESKADEKEEIEFAPLFP